ncbi:MAG: aminoacyl-tRNA hydrolase [Patescibacteria group bacterium]
MIIVFGLGNNEGKYLETKHNAGRIVLESWVQDLGLKFEQKDKYYFAKETASEPIYYVYSRGYMNTSGQALQSFIDYFKIKFSPDDILIVLQDDSDQLTGNLKLVSGGGSAGHNGINDIYRHLLNWNLDLQNMWRFKIGIRPENNRAKSETFVLSGCAPAEINWFKSLGLKWLEYTPLLLKRDWSKLQQNFHTKL